MSKYGTKVDEIFLTYEELKSKYGKDVEKLPLGAIGIYTASQKIRTGLQQLMAGSRNFNLSTIRFSEDLSTVRKGNAPPVLASLRNIAVILLRGRGVNNLARARREAAASPWRALAVTGR